MEHVAWPLPSSVVVLVVQLTGCELGSVTTQPTSPVGVPAEPVTVTVKIRVPPVTRPDALSATVVSEAVDPAAPPAVGQRPSESAKTAPTTAMNRPPLVFKRIPLARPNRRTSPRARPRTGTCQLKSKAPPTAQHTTAATAHDDSGPVRRSALASEKATSATTPRPDEAGICRDLEVLVMHEMGRRPVGSMEVK